MTNARVHALAVSFDGACPTLHGLDRIGCMTLSWISLALIVYVTLGIGAALARLPGSLAAAMASPRDRLRRLGDVALEIALYVATSAVAWPLLAIVVYGIRRDQQRAMAERLGVILMTTEPGLRSEIRRGPSEN